MPEPLWTLQELADYLGVHHQTVRRWNLTGGGPPSMRLGKYFRYRPDDVNEWLEAHRQERNGTE